MQVTVLHVIFHHEEARWRLEQESASLGVFDSKVAATAEGQKRCRELHRSGVDAQLAIHDQNGSIEYEWTCADGSRQANG